VNAWNEGNQDKLLRVASLGYDHRNRDLVFMISGSLSPLHSASPGCEWRNGLQY